MMTTALDVDFVGNMQRALAGQSSPDGLPTPDPRVLTVLLGQEPATDRDAELDRRVAVWRALSGDVLPFDPEEFRRGAERAIDHAGDLPQPSLTHWPPRCPWREASSWAASLPQRW